jgi:hypothetical protein
MRKLWEDGETVGVWENYKSIRKLWEYEETVRVWENCVHEHGSSADRI